MKIVFYDKDPYVGGKEEATYQLLKYLNDKENIYYAYNGSIDGIILKKVSEYAQIINLNEVGDAIECDVVVYCTVWGYTNQIVAKKRGLWVHGLITDAKASIFKEKFDFIVFVSQTTKDFYINKIDNVSQKYVIYNIINKEKLFENANEFYEIKKGKDITLCTVSRLSPEKGIKKIQFIANMLKKANLHYVWYVIGDGTNESYVKELKDLFKSYQNIIFMGKMENPHKIVRQCDFIVQLSSQETQCLSVLEAKMLGVNAILSDLPAFREFFNNEIFSDNSYSYGMIRKIKEKMKEPKKEYIYNENKEIWKEILYGKEENKDNRPTRTTTRTTKNTKKVSKTKGKNL